MLYSFNVIFSLMMVAMLVIAASLKLRRPLQSGAPARVGDLSVDFVQRHYWILFVLILAAGVFVRVWQFGNIPYGLNQDGAMAGLDGYALALYGTDRFGTSYPAHLWAWGYGQMSALYSYICIPFFRVLGLSRFSLRLPILVISIAMLPVFWDLARRLVGKNFALLAFFFVCINPWQIMQSRWALDCNMMGHCLLLGVYLLAIGAKPNRTFALYLSMVPLGLCMYAYGVAIYSVPVLLILAAGYLLYRRRTKFIHILFCAVIFLAISAPVILTMMINAFGWETITLGPITLQSFYENERSAEIAFMAEDMYKSLCSNAAQWLKVTFLQGYDSSTFNSIPGYRTLYIFSFPALIMGLIYLVRDRRSTALKGLEAGEGGLKRDAAFFIEAWLIAMFVCGMLTGSPNVNRSNGVYYALILVLAYGIYQIVRNVRAFVPLVAVMYLFAFTGQCVTYFGADYNAYTTNNYHAGLYEAIVATRTFSYEYDGIYITSSDEDAGSNATSRLIAPIALGLDRDEMNDEKELVGADGEPIGYFTDWYYFTDFADFEPSPMGCAIYVITQKEKLLFSEDDYLLWDYYSHAIAYPRYWAED